MKIGLVIPKRLIDSIEEYIHKEFPNTETVAFSYDMIPDIPGIIEGRQSSCDALLFLGETALRWSSKEVSSSIPWAIIPRTSASLLRLLVRAARGGQRMRIATDFQKPEFFLQAFYEAGLSSEESSVCMSAPLPYTPDLPEHDAAALEAFYQAGKADFCITIYYRVFLLLHSRQIPVYMLQPAFEDIRHAVQELITSCHLRISTNSQIAVVAIHTDPPSAPSEGLSDYELSLEQLQITRRIYEFAHRIQAACMELSSREYLLFSTRRPVEQETNYFHSLNLLQTVLEETDLTLSAGIGYGATADEAKEHARKAMNRAMAGGGNQAFFLGEQGGLIGPFCGSQTIVTPEPNQKLSALSQATGISLRHLILLARLCRQQGKNCFTPAELADASGISLRTMNRMLLKLMDCGCCEEAGRHFAHRTGRPSRIVELHIEN